jgi:hypothetical protein
MVLLCDYIADLRQTKQQQRSRLFSGWLAAAFEVSLAPTK